MALLFPDGHEAVVRLSALGVPFFAVCAQPLLRLHVRDCLGPLGSAGVIVGVGLPTVV